jgi:putative PEP-CTERM system TPR-repeat lipoprotein
MLVQLYLRTGEADKALALARALAEAQPGDAGLLVLLGRAQLMAGDAKSAEASFGAAGKLRPADKRIPVSAALARLSRGPAGSALEELESLAASDKGTTADMAVISERVRRKDYAGALRAVNALGAKQPDLALPELLRGNIAMLQGNMAAARKGFEGALAKDPGFFQAAALLANLDLAEGKPDAARSRFEALVAHNPRQVNAHMALAQMAARSGAGKATVLRHIEAAIAANPAAPGPRAALVDLHSASGDNALALTAAQNAVAAAPDDVDLLERLGRAQQASGNPNQAVPTFSRIAALRPELAWPHLRLVDMHIASNNMDAASASMRRALEAEPRSPQVLRAGIAMALRSGEAGKARAIARKVQTDQADDAIGYLLEGEIELNQNRPEDAVTVLRKALTKRAPNEAAPRLHQALLMAKKQADAERMAEAWTKAHPEDVAFALHLASSAAQQGDAAQAESRYRAVLKRYPDHVLALNNLAYLLLKQKKPGVVALAEKAVALAPDQPLLMDTLALGYAQENQLPKGLAMQARVVAMAPDVADYRLNLARLHIQAGDTAAARLELGKLAARGKDAPAQEEVARLLKSLGG